MVLEMWISGVVSAQKSDHIVLFCLSDPLSKYQFGADTWHRMRNGRIRIFKRQTENLFLEALFNFQLFFKVLKYKIKVKGFFRCAKYAQSFGAEITHGANAQGM